MMAPLKKDVDKSSTPAKKPKNPPTNKGKPKKQARNAPSVIKIKMPPLKGLGDSSIQEKEMESLQHTSKQILASHKIDLANEVALAQLKKPTASENPPEPPPDTKPAPKRRKPKKVMPQPSTLNNLESIANSIEVALAQLKKSTASENPPEPPPGTKPTPKRRGPKKITSNNLENFANSIEAALAQIKKPTASEKCPEPPPDIKPPLKRRRPKKIVSQVTTPNNLENIANRIEEALATPPKKPIRKTPAKLMETINTPEKNVEVANKQKADSTSTLKRRGRKKKEETITESLPIGETPARRILRKPKGKAIDNVTTSNEPPSPSSLQLKKGIFFEKKPLSPIKKDIQPPCLIDSRKTSLTSTTGSLSWTKDISSSSTTTCVSVCCNDFVRIDKKLPVLKLHNVDKMFRDFRKDEIEDRSDIGDTTNCSSSSSDTSDRPSVNLSSSSDSDTSESESNPAEEYNELKSTLDKLSTKLQTLDLEVINWIGSETEESNMNIRKLHDTVLKLLVEENDIIHHCNTLKKILVDGSETREREKTATMVDIDRSEEDENFTSTAARYVMLDPSCHDDEPLLRDVTNVEEEPDRMPYIPYDQVSNFDNSDVISIFADDTLTGMDAMTYPSATPSISGPLNDEEYVPKPIHKNTKIILSKVTYNPTRIVNELQKRVCEKQNADSTSIFKEPIAPPKLVPVSKLMPPPPPPPPLPPMPCRLASVYPRPVTSTLFRGICTRNLTDHCRRPNCYYSHDQLDIHEHTNKLCRLSDEKFIEEYIFIRKYPPLLRKYINIYVDDCTRREMTRVLVEMAIDTITQFWINTPDEDECVINVTEETLMHLNRVDLKLCEDLLKESVGQNKLVCDFFMERLAKTQNFSRFKQVFVRLTDFLVQNRRNIDLNVATHILERVCILPHEGQIAQALVKIIKATDVAILRNQMMGLFEKQLLSFDNVLYELLMAYKEGHYKPSEVAEDGCSQRSNAEQINQERYTSPDTTKSDIANKPQLEQVVIRKDIPPPPTFAPYQSNSTSTDSSPDYRPKNNTKFRTWKPFKPRTHHHMARALGPQKRHLYRQVTYEPNAKIPRRTGPDMF